MTTSVKPKAPKIQEIIVAPEPVMPELFGVVKYEGDFDDLPRSPFPYYVVAGNGFFSVKETLIGRVLLKEQYYPDHFEEIPDEYKNGYFNYTLPRIPAHVMSQALDFFRITFEKIKAEAEVLLLYRADTQEYDLFVPYQVVSGGKVDSIYDQAHLPEGWDVIGTIHSHCEMNAFHSGIDEGDARDFNGIHITIGHVTSNNPSFDAMVMINKKKFQYQFAESVAEIEGDLDLLAAPEAWFNEFIKKPEEILAMDFPTLTRAELDAFGTRTRPTIWEAPNKAATAINDGKDWQNSYYGSGTPYYTPTKWSDVFRVSLPREWFESDSFQAKLKPEYFAKQLDIELAKWAHLAKDNGFELVYGVNVSPEVSLLNNLLDDENATIIQ